MSTQHSHLIPSRAAKRAHFDKETIYPILDEALFCTISYVVDDMPFSIPTGFVRYENKLYIHGSVGSHFIWELEKGKTACISVTLLDALVVAKSAFSHSMNYRSVVLFAKAEKVEDINEKHEVLKWFTNKMVPGSWDYLRPLQENELRKTTILAFDISEASAKVRTGWPNDEPEDKPLPIWSGIIPLDTVRRDPLSDEISQSIPLPLHLQPK